MIQVTNVIHHVGVEWDDYLKLPGTSFSGLKGFYGKESYGMKIGRLVHTYVLKPKEYNYEEYEIVKPLASKLVDYVGVDILKLSIIEQPITADFETAGFRFKWKGIPDINMPNIVVVDFKVINGDLEYYCDRFNYPNQIRGYMMPNKAQLGLIIAVNRTTKQTQVKLVTQKTDWWTSVIIANGESIKQIV